MQKIKNFEKVFLRKVKLKEKKSDCRKNCRKKFKLSQKNTGFRNKPSKKFFFLECHEIDRKKNKQCRKLKNLEILIK